MKDRLESMIVVFATMVLAACGAVPEESPPFDEASLAENSEPLFARTIYLWSRAIPNWNRTIPVCWQTAGYDTEKGWVREAIQRTWERESDVKFTGWGVCNSSNNSGIRIKTSDERPYTQGLGTQLKGLTNGMVLNFWFTYFDAGTQPYDQCISTARKNCIQNHAIHEFGHALGFAHEHLRGDTPATCRAEKIGTPGSETYSWWDQNSIMNYCNPAKDVDFTSLSNIDIGGLIKYYRSPRSSLWQGIGSGRCIGTTGEGDGSEIQLVDCPSPSRTRWTLTPEGRMVDDTSGRCLDIRAHGTTNGSVIQLYTCIPGNPNQAWFLRPDGSLYNAISGRCLDVSGAATAAGSRLQLWDCNGQTNQRWTRLSTIIKGLDSSRCLDAKEWVQISH